MIQSLLMLLMAFYIPHPSQLNKTTEVYKVEKNIILHENYLNLPESVRYEPRLVQWVFYEQTDDMKLVICGWCRFRENHQLLKRDNRLILFEDGREKIVIFEQYQESVTNYDKEVESRADRLDEDPAYRMNRWLRE